MYGEEVYIIDLFAYIPILRRRVLLDELQPILDKRILLEFYGRKDIFKILLKLTLATVLWAGLMRFLVDLLYKGETAYVVVVGLLVFLVTSYISKNLILIFLLNKYDNVMVTVLRSKVLTTSLAKKLVIQVSNRHFISILGFFFPKTIFAFTNKEE